MGLQVVAVFVMSLSSPLARPPIVLIGDVHDDWELFFALLAKVPQPAHVIQVGDLARYPHLFKYRQWQRPPVDVMYLDGNHHYYPETRDLTTPTDVAPGLTYLPRGTVLELEGRRVGILGGGDSILDRASRTRDHDWWPAEEATTAADVARLLDAARAVGGLDLLVTHTPPALATALMRPAGRPAHPSAIQVHAAWEALGRPPLVAGHMHEAWSRHGITVLDYLGVTVVA